MMTDEVLFGFNELLKQKNEEVEFLLNSKNKKMRNKSTDLDYDSKKTLSKITAEQKRKYESSKAYKKEQSINI
jgi:hypothetical protein